MPYALSLAALAILIAAATTDAIERRIPNGLSLALAAIGLARLVLDLAGGGSPLAAGADLAVAVAVFLAGAVAFRFGLFGGGDVKLLAAATLWLGAGELLPFLMATALAGGLLALGFLAWVFIRRDSEKVALPYGVAIAAGALYVTGGTFWP